MLRTGKKRSVVRLGTRSSHLARWQTDHVKNLISDRFPTLRFETIVITTQGDSMLDMPLPLIGGKGLFTNQLEEQLMSGSIDLAVHSLKDLPTNVSDGVLIGAIPKRANPADVLVSRQGHTLNTLPDKASIGSTSPRRAAQILHCRPDLQMKDIRGNVDTRLVKAFDPEGTYDGIILARAGLERLNRLNDISQVFTYDQMLPAPGQGALAVQCRAEEYWLNILSEINDSESEFSVAAERSFLEGLGGGCSVPISALGVFRKGELSLRGRVTAWDGSRHIDVSETAPLQCVDRARELGIRLARKAANEGADEILK